MKDKQILELKQDIRNINTQYESLIKSKDEQFLKDKSQLEVVISNSKVKFDMFEEEVKTCKFTISRLKYDMKQKTDELEKMKGEKQKLKRKLETSIIFDPKNL